MRTFFIVLGAASVAYGAFILSRKAEEIRSTSRRMGGAMSGAPGIDPSRVVTGPTNPDSNTMPVDNSISMVQQYGSGMDKFPPMTYIGLPVAGALGNDYDDVYQPIKF